jgi:hypothetical protein
MHRGICRRSRTHSRSCGTPCRAPCSGRRAVRPLARALQPIPGSVPRSAGLPNTHDAHAGKADPEWWIRQGHDPSGSHVLPFARFKPRPSPRP